MGYVPPPPPDFGQQYVGGWKLYRASDLPSTGYRRYVWDLYGERGDWLPVLSFTLLLLIVALVAAVAWLLLTAAGIPLAPEVH